MAIDGVKIIDSDSAYDVYNPIMEKYHFGASIEEIQKEIDAFESDFTFSELHHEIFTTAYALAMWEIGALSDSQLKKVREIVKKGASDLWDEVASDAKKDRQKILVKFLKKIEKPNPKVKKRKNYRMRTDFIFSPGDVLVFQFPSKAFGATVLIDTYQEGRTLYYAFAELVLDATVVNINEKPTLEDVTWFSKTHARFNIGFDSNKTVSHNKLLTFKSKFEKIGTVEIKSNFRRIGSMSGSVYTFDEFCDDWCVRKGKIKNLHELLEC